MSTGFEQKQFEHGFGVVFGGARSTAQSKKPRVVRAHRHAYVAMSKLVQVIFAERRRFERLIRAERKYFGIQWWRFRDSNPGPADYDENRSSFIQQNQWFTRAKPHRVMRRVMRVWYRGRVRTFTLSNA